MKTCRDPHTSPLRQLLPSLVLLLGMLWGSYPCEAQTPKQTPPRAERHTSVEGITEYRLPNGLRALLIPDTSRDTITLNLTYLVGSRHEGYGESGMAHLLEHLLFRGTSRMGNVMAELNKRGARFNGTTNFDYTNYYQTVSASDDNLHWMLALEADRMLNSRVSWCAMSSNLARTMPVAYYVNASWQQLISGTTMAGPSSAHARISRTCRSSDCRPFIVTTISPTMRY